MKAGIWGVGLIAGTHAEIISRKAIGFYTRVYSKKRLARRPIVCYNINS